MNGVAPPRPVPPDAVPMAVDAVTVVNAPAAGVTLPMMPWNDVPVATPKVGVVSIGLVSVLFVRVSVPANVANVPVVGKVTFVVPVRVLVYAKLPEPVTVIAALFDTPVPPLAAPRVPVMSAVERLTASHEALVPSV